MVGQEVNHLLGPSPVKSKDVVVPDVALVGLAGSVELEAFELLHDACNN